MPVCYLREQNKKLPPRVSVYFIQLHYILATNGEKKIKFIEEDCNTHGIFVGTLIKFEIRLRIQDSQGK